MAFLVQRGSSLHLRRSRKRNGRVYSEYVAAGELAVLLYALDQEDRAERAAQREVEQAEQRTIDDVNDQLAEIQGRARRLARTTLEGAGFHQHARSKWRKRRCPNT